MLTESLKFSRPLLRCRNLKNEMIKSGWKRIWKNFEILANVFCKKVPICFYTFFCKMTNINDVWKNWFKKFMLLKSDDRNHRISVSFAIQTKHISVVRQSNNEIPSLHDKKSRKQKGKYNFFSLLSVSQSTSTHSLTPPLSICLMVSRLVGMS